MSVRQKTGTPVAALRSRVLGEGGERHHGGDAADLTTDGHRALREMMGAYLLDDGLDDAERNGCAPTSTDVYPAGPSWPR